MDKFAIRMKVFNIPSSVTDRANRQKNQNIEDLTNI